MNPFHVISKPTIEKFLSATDESIFNVIKETYLLHGASQTINPDSYFLRYPNPSNRIIALPAHIDGDVQSSGIKWISSFPDNIQKGFQRASAVLLLNDGETGYPYACLESSLISAVRTSVSAVCGAYYLNHKSKRGGALGIIGAGFIAHNIVKYFALNGWVFDKILICDFNNDYAHALGKYASEALSVDYEVVDTAEALIESSSISVSSTTAGQPYISESVDLSHNPILLNVSLRDWSVPTVLQCFNVMDDVEHCLKANTSPHLTFLETGNKDFIAGSIDQIITGEISVPKDKPRMFSPFGLGVLDIALGHYVYNKAIENNDALNINDFFGDMSR